MLYLNVSNRTENLLAQLAALLTVDQQTNPFAQELFLIQSRGMERLIAQRMADSFSCFANFQFFLPLNCIRFFSEKVGLGFSAEGFEKDILVWRVEAELRNIEEEIFAPIRNYLSGDNVARKRFQLARHLADLFDQYQVMRPAMLAAWEEGRTETGVSAEGWQQFLWNRMVSRADGMHRGALLARLIATLEKGKVAQDLPKRLMVFGVHSMPPVFLHFLGALASHIDVHLYLLSPCRQYWGDAPAGRKQLAAMIEGEGAGGSLVDNPLLATLGRQGRDFQNMLLTDVDIGGEFESYDAAVSDADYAELPLLGKLQADLLLGRAPAGVCPQQGGDDSLAIVSCHSRLRELQVLKDHILYLLEHNPKLQLRDLVVMAPNIQEYSGLIPAVFNDMQHSIADRSLRGKNQVISGFMRFLALLLGRFGWSELLDFLRLPTVFPALGLVDSDLDAIEKWVVDSGIRWGLSAEQRQRDGLAPLADASWRAGLDRLLMGLAVDCQEGNEFVHDVLPYDGIEGKSGLALGALCRLYDLVARSCSDIARPRPLAEWGEQLVEWINALWPDDSAQDVTELHSLLAESITKTASYHSGDVEFLVLLAWLQDLMDDTRSSSGFLRGQLMFCSMLPMRSIPFEVICLIGLNDGVFPKTDRRDTFDLLAASFIPGDRSPRADDRYQFLEAIVAARSHLFLSYIGQSIKNHEEIPPSVVVAEFLDLLRDGYGQKNIVVKHPLHAFSERYFQKDCRDNLCSYNADGFRTAQSMADGRKAESSWWEGELPEAAASTGVSTAELLRFLQNPPAYFVRDCLGIKLDFGQELPEDRELFNVGGLDRYLVEDYMLRSALDNRLVPYAEAKALGLWGLGAPGELSYNARLEEIAVFADKIQCLGMGVRQNDLFVDIDVGSCTLSGQLANVYTGGVLLVRNGPIRGRDLLVGWLHHLLLEAAGAKPLTKIACNDEVFEFQDIPDEVSLAPLLRLYAMGCTKPLTIFPEPARLYGEQLLSPKGKKSPLQKAEENLSRSLENGYEPEWALLYGAGGQVLEGTDFEPFCLTVMMPLLQCCTRTPW